MLHSCLEVVLSSQLLDRCVKTPHLHAQPPKMGTLVNPFTEQSQALGVSKPKTYVEHRKP